MTGPTAPRFFTTTQPPPTERLALNYFAPLVAPTPVATRLPRPADTADTINGFLRVEAAGGVLCPDGLLWDVSIILHAYAPNTQEAMAELLITEAVAWGANAQGCSTVVGDKSWYVTYSRCSGYVMRKADPMVALTRYRAMVTWRMPGLAVLPGHMFVRHPVPDPGQAVAAAAVAPGVAVTVGKAAAKATRSASPPGAPRPNRKR